MTTPSSTRARYSTERRGSPWQALVRVGGLIRRLSEPHFTQYGLSSAQWGVLRALDRLEARGHGEPRMNELGDELLVHPPSLSATIDRMVRAGLVTRREDADDQRTRRIGLTKAGRTRLNNALDDHHAWVRRMLAGLSSEEQEQLGALLHRLGDHLALELGDTNQSDQEHKSQGSQSRRRTRARRSA